jgi:hypothetical protein
MMKAEAERRAVWEQNQRADALAQSTAHAAWLAGRQQYPAQQTPYAPQQQPYMPPQPPMQDQVPMPAPASPSQDAAPVISPDDDGFKPPV